MYNPANWYWIGKPDGRSDVVIYASARDALVAADDAAYVAWVDAGGAATPWPPNEAGAFLAMPPSAAVNNNSTSSTSNSVSQTNNFHVSGLEASMIASQIASNMDRRANDIAGLLQGAAK